MTPQENSVIRDLARQYADACRDPWYASLRDAWARHHSLQPAPPLILVTFGVWNVWCRETFGDAALCSTDPLLRTVERWLRMQLFHRRLGDDFILEPWYPYRAHVRGDWDTLWGLEQKWCPSGVEGGASAIDPPLKDWKDMDRLRAPVHEVDEVRTAEDLARLKDVLGDLLTVDVSRRPACHGFSADISTHLIRLRGLEQVMIDMYEEPQQLHRLLAFMRDGILANQEAAERAGHYSLTSHENQAMPYAEELEWPKSNSGPRPRRSLWAFCAAQEFTLVSPAQHEEFLFQYQRPILKHFGLVHYGCCENLTPKIAMLRRLPNLRSIAVTPSADLRQCVEQIGRDYVISWRPNPTEMVAAGWDEARIRRIIREGCRIARDSCMHIHLKDIETVQGDLDRLPRWVRIAREEVSRVWG